MISRIFFIHALLSPRSRSAARWYSEDLMTYREGLAMAADDNMRTFFNYWKAMGILLFRPQQWENRQENGFFRYHLPCLAAMLLGRGYKNTDKTWHYETLCWFNHVNTYGGWNCDLLQYNPTTFRFHIGSDGDCNL